MNLKNGKVFTSKFFGTGPSSYEKRIYRAAVSQRLRNTGLSNRPRHPVHTRVDTHAYAMKRTGLRHDANKDA